MMKRGLEKSKPLLFSRNKNNSLNRNEQKGELIMGIYVKAFFEGFIEGAIEILAILALLYGLLVMPVKLISLLSRR